MDRKKNAFQTLGRLLVVAFVVITFLPSSLRADNVMQLNLRELCQRADKIFRGTVLSAMPGTVHAGGGELPIVTYRIKVDESFKGNFTVVKGIRFIDVRMLGSLEHGRGDRSRTVRFLSAPRLVPGQTYLLLTTQPSSIGLSVPVGLGQGCFRIVRANGGEAAVNGYGNKLLFRGMDLKGQEVRGPIKYTRLAERIRELVHEAREKR